MNDAAYYRKITDEVNQGSELLEEKIRDAVTSKNPRFVRYVAYHVATDEDRAKHEWLRIYGGVELGEDLHEYIRYIVLSNHFFLSIRKAVCVCHPRI